MISLLPPLRISVPVVILILGCVLGGWWSYQTLQRGYERVEQSQVEAARLTAAFAIPQVEAFYRLGEPERARTFLNRLNADRELRRVLLVDADGAVRYSAQFAEEGGVVPPDLADLADQALTADRDVVRLEGDWVRSAFPVRLATPDELAGAFRGVLLMERDLRFLRQQARHEAWESLLETLAVILVLCAVTAGVLHQIVTRRLRRLIGATERLAGGETGIRSGLSGRDELAQIGQAFDEMALRIEVTQRQLRDREQMFARLIEHGTDIIGLVDEDGVIQFISPSVHRTLGLMPGELLGRSIFELVHAQDREAAERGFAEVMHGGQRLRAIEVRLRRADGEWVTIEAVGNTLGESGSTEMVINARDITEWKALQDRLRQSEKMQAVGQLAGGIAHDFNNLLTVIAGYASLVDRDCAPGSAAQGHVDEIRKAADRGANLVRQLLAFSRKQVLKPQYVDLNRVIAELENLLRRTLGEQVTLELDLADTPATVRADPTQLDQVLVNLAVNARQAMPEGGRLTIRTKITDAASLPPRAECADAAGRYVLLTVRDNGVGIAPEIKDRIFDPFFTSRSAGGGTGLGLATVHGIVNQSNGAIWVDSTVGEGATFTICLPHVEAMLEAAPPSSREPAANQQSAPGRALVVEDAPAVRNLVGRTLSEAGYEVAMAESIEEACAYLHRSVDAPPDLIVSDLVLPDGSGRQVAELAARELPSAAIVLMSGYAEELVGEMDTSSRYVFIAKPFCAEALIAAICAAISANDPGKADRPGTGEAPA